MQINLFVLFPANEGGSLIDRGVHICDNVVIQGGICVNKNIEESGVHMRNTFMRREDVWNCEELFENKKIKNLERGIKVFLDNNEKISVY